MIFWAAEESAFTQYKDALKKWDALGTRAELSTMDDDETPLPYEKIGNVGVVGIRGPLVSGSTGWFGALFGITGYEDIADAVAMAVADKDVQSILYRVNSPGGMVDGLDVALDTMRSAKAVLPTMTYADYMASAALWLGSASEQVSAGRTALVGSVGVLSGHVDMSKAYEDAGIKITTIRSDPDKAPGQRHEPLTEKYKETLEALTEDLRDIFVGDLAVNYCISASTVKKNFGAGKMFLAGEALDHKMIHKVESWPQALGRASRIGKRKAKKK